MITGLTGLHVVQGQPPSAKHGLTNLTEKGKALWLLAIMSPVVAELCSGSSPPLEFFNPISFALLLGLYGAGVLIMRELSVIWNLGWFGVILLGSAYGILEEGVAIKSFFDPEWMDLGGLGEYGRYLGTNLVWAVWLTIFHAVISITVPIVLIGFMYPQFKGQRFLEGRRFKIVLLIMLLDVLVCFFLLNPYVPYLPMYLLSILAVFGLVFYAKHFPRKFMMPKEGPPTWTPRRFFVMGFAFLLLCFVLAGLFVETIVAPIVPIALMLALSTYVILMLEKHMGCRGNLPHKGYFIAGILSLLLFLDFVLGLGGAVDMVIVGVFLAIFIFDLTRWSAGKTVLIFFRQKAQRTM